MHNHSYENESNLHVNEISFSYEKMGTKTRFEEEAKSNSEMAYWSVQQVGKRTIGRGNSGSYYSGALIKLNSTHVIGSSAKSAKFEFQIEN